MTTTRRVLISHTSEFTKYPEKKSFIDAAIAAVIRAKCLPCDMEYFTARDEKPAQYCIERVRECEVYVGVIGLRYGSPVRDRPEVSYTELEFEAASQVPTKKRLVFLLDPDSSVPVGRFMDVKYGDRQEKFRQRLNDAGVTCKPFSDVRELEMLIYQALIEGVAGAREQHEREERIDWPEGKSPYPGLLWFGEEYASLFFGRDREVDELVAKMSEPGGRVVVVSGASGSGKSSLVAAGVWHALLKEGRLPGSIQWIWFRIQPGDGETPFHSLAWGFKQAFPRLSLRPDDVAKKLATGGTALGELLAAHLNQGQEMILFIDQLEELFTRGFKDQDIQAFLKQLIRAAHEKTNRLRLVATIRSEFLGRLEAYESTLAILNGGYNYHLGPVSPRILQDMIEKPAQATGFEFDSGLVEQILNDAGQEPGNLPLVAYTLKQLFERRREQTFTRDAYQAIGGVAGAIGTKADQVVAELPDDVRRAFDTVFAELVHIERERPPTRKRETLSRFSSEEAAAQLIDALAGPECRVLVKSGNIVEVAHEKLFTAWPKLKHWIDGSGDALRLIDYAEEAARRWHDLGGHLRELWWHERAQPIQQALLRFNKTPSPDLEMLLHPQQMLIERLNDETLSHQDRLRIGQKLSEFGDPRFGVGLRSDSLPDIVWIDIPGGRIKLEDINHVFEVKPFRMAKYLVTNAQFEAFIKAEDGYRNEEWWRGMEKSDAAAEPNWQEANAPRETVSWFEAVAFCRWLSHRTRSTIHLPTEWEWQQGATGGDLTRKYPWSGEWDTSRCNSTESRLNRTAAVGLYPHGATQQGVMDMAGNLWEWCLNKFKHPEAPESLRIDESHRERVVRGGSWNNRPVGLRVSTRNRFKAVYRPYFIGFRLAQDIP